MLRVVGASCAPLLVGAACSLVGAGCSSAGSSSTSQADAGAGNGGAEGGVGSAETGPGVPRIDEVGYYQALAKQRPDLTGNASTCYDALVMKQTYRSAILDAGATPASLEAAYEADAGVAADQAYILGQQQAEVAFCAGQPVAGCGQICKTTCAPCPPGGFTAGSGALPPYYPSGYGLCAFVGYEQGPYGPINENGLDYKVFFEFADATTQLTPEAYQGFAAALADAGYVGDSKVLTDPSLPLQARFQYNDIITHAGTVAEAEVIERVGLSMFGPELTGYGRGLDVGPPIYTTLVDWHTYLCDVQGSLAALPAEAQAYVLFED